MKKILITYERQAGPRSELMLGIQFAKALHADAVLATLAGPEHVQPNPNLAALQAESDLGLVGIAVEARSLTGGWTEAILSEVQSDDYSMIVMSAKLAGLHEKLFSQPVINQVFQGAGCPIAVVKRVPGRLKNFLVCESGFLENPVIDRFSSQFRELIVEKPQITILHVMSQMTAYPGVKGSQLRAEADELITEGTPEGELLEHDQAVLEQAQIYPVPKVRHGLVVDEIVQEIEEGDFDLVVIGAHHGEGWQRFLLFDNAHEIISRSKESVLVVP